MLKINLKIALRNLWKHKGFALINVGGLAIGLACCLILLLYVNYEWSYDRQFTNIDRTYVVYNNQKASDKTVTFDATPGRLAPFVKQNMAGVEHASRITTDKKPFTYARNTFSKDVLFADPELLKIFDYKFISGDAVSALATPASAVLTETTAKTLFGKSDAIGKVIKYDDKKELKVTAVIADLPYNLTERFDILIPWAFFEQENDWTKTAGWPSNFCSTIIQLKDNTYFDQVDKKLRKIINANQNNYNAEAFLFPYSKYHLYDKFENGKQAGGRIDQVKLFILLAFCILLIACVNYMNLSTARSEKRAREVGVRKAIGSSRMALVSQFLIESIMLSLLAMLLAFVILEVALPYFNNRLDIHMFIDYSSVAFWSTLLLLALFTGLLAGSYPSFYLSSFAPVKVLKGFTGTKGGGLPVRKVLVVLQFSFSVCMIICAIIIYTQMTFMKNRPLGFNKDSMAQITVQGEMAKPGKLKLFQEELLKTGAVTSATGFSWGFTSGGFNTYGFEWPGKQPTEKILMNFRTTGYDFVKTTGTKVIEGRDFSREFASDSSAVLLNEAAVAAMQLKNPIGAKIKQDKGTYTVIGVLKNYAYESAGYKVSPTLLFLGENAARVLLVNFNPKGNLSQSVQKVKEIGAGIDPVFPLEVKFISKSMTDKLRAESILSMLSNLFGGFAIFISCLGLLGLALYMAEQRSKEISIRKVLGADLGNILVLLNRDFIKLVIIANIIACPVAYWIALNWLQKYDSRIALTLWPFVIAVAMSLIIALITVSIQTLKVARAKAVDALKYE